MQAEQLQGNQAVDIQGSIRRLAGKRGWEAHLQSQRAAGEGSTGTCLTQYPIANLLGKWRVDPKGLQGVIQVGCTMLHIPSRTAGWV